MVKAVIFDLDGVVTDTANYHYRAWKRLAEELGLPFDEKTNELLKGVDRLTSLEIILKNSARQYTISEKQELASRKNEYYICLLESMNSGDILEGTLKTLDDLNRVGIKTALASASKNAFRVIDKLDIKPYFDFIADASKITKGKPDPEIFLAAAKGVNVKPPDCIGIDDAQAGIKAIKAANMYAVGIGDKETLKDADDVIKGLYEFDVFKYLG